MTPERLAELRDYAGMGYETRLAAAELLDLCDIAQELQRLRKTNTRLNRRCQQQEAAIAELVAERDKLKGADA